MVQSIVAFRILLLSLGLLFFSMSSLAVTLHLSEEQLNSMLTMSFPMNYQSGDYNITLSDPKTVFYNEERRVGLNAQMDVKGPNGEPAFNGRGIVSGELHFNTQRRQLQLIRPRLNELDVRQVSQDFKPMMEQTKTALMEQRMPLIVLVDLQTVAPYLPLQSMTSVRVGHNAIIVEF